MVMLSLLGEESEPVVLARKWGESGYRHYDLGLSRRVRGWFSPWFLSSLPLYELSGLLWCLSLRLRGVRRFLVQDAVFSGLFVAVVCKLTRADLYLFDHGSAVNLTSGLLEKELSRDQPLAAARIQLRLMRFTRWMSLRSCRVFFVHSREMMSLALRSGLPDERICWYAFPVDSSVFRRDAEGRKRLRGRLRLEKRFCLMYAGRMTLDKGLPLLVEAYSKLLEESPGRLSLVLVGDGPEKSALIRMCEGLQGVTFVGRVDEPWRVAELMNAADAFCYPIVFSGGIPIAVLEAMACELPVIVGPAGPLKEAIEDGVDGFVMKEAQASEIVRVVRMLLKDSRLGRKIGRKARQKVVKQFGKESYRETVVRKILASR